MSDLLKVREVLKTPPELQAVRMIDHQITVVLRTYSKEVIARFRALLATANICDVQFKTASEIHSSKTATPDTGMETAAALHKTAHVRDVPDPAIDQMVTELPVDTPEEA